MSTVVRNDAILSDRAVHHPDAGSQRLYEISTQQVVAAIGLGLVLLLGAFLRFYQLGAYSIGNTYYAATIKSMLTSWHNFFYASFEPGGSVTVDKPPLGFWVQAISAYFLGVNGFALALPQALAGVLSIGVLYKLVKRYFGVLAGLTAALALAVTPVTIATERNNTIDGLLVFVLLLAAWAFIKATETGRLRHLLLGAILVGVGFNIKMLQAFMPLPAFYALYLFGCRHAWWKRILHLGAATVVLLVVSLSWAVAVDLTPADQRPYIGSSTDNTVMELIIGHNGLARLGLLNRGPGRGRAPQDDGRRAGRVPPGDGRPAPPPRDGAPVPGDGPSMQGFAGRPPAPSGGRAPFGNVPPLAGDGGGNVPVRPGGGPGGPGETGRAGLTRLFSQPLVEEASWLLPLALLGILLTALVLGWAWPLSQKHLALLFWAGWLLPELTYFSFTAGLFHRYYLIMLGPPLAALVGITLWAVAQLARRRRWLALGALVMLIAVTLGLQAGVVSDYAQLDWLMPLAAAIAVTGLGLLALGSTPALRKVALGLVLAGLLAAPFFWSVQAATTYHPNVALPTASLADNQATTFMTPNKVDMTANDEAILNYLLAHTEPDTYLLATLNTRSAAPFILATGRPVLTFGGFSGSDNIVSAGGLAQMVADGQVRYVLGLPQQKPDLANWIADNCSVVNVPGLTVVQDNKPAGRAFPPGRPAESEVLYDCGH
ncbi:MAG: glycosyltransferase family 39 protein [Anaerolineae bacterium]